ncbi:unnamed protein product [Rotaria socialis]|uniref:Uncharacterized protein n=1 Tax=Rotaria socialis TaxID=392032 RepID=A0A818ABC9_9BILA|nr:unnamed protein product [Rotaria socialis]CAF4609248.1 unnamed protein product [Rotaria socialis]
MLKLCLFTIFLLLSPIFGLLESLFQSQNDCYSKCDLNHAVGLSNSDACKKGCDYKLHGENCAVQCKLLAIDERNQASCFDGCSSSNLLKPVPVENVPSQSIILIRLRQRPLAESSLLNGDSMRMFMDMIRKIKENRNFVNQSNDINTDSLNTENTYKMTRLIIYRKDKTPSTNNRFKQYLNDVHSKWNDLIRKQPEIPAWICFCFLLFSSAFLLYMIVSLYFHTPRHHTLSIHAEKLATENIYEKEKFPSNEQEYQYKESVPIKF